MSALPAEFPAPRRRLPGRPGTESPHGEPTRHIEIAPSRDQRRARPRLIVAIVTVGGLFAILAAQLLLTIATSEGAYEIATLQAQQNELARDEQVLREQLGVLEAPQHLAAEAQAMGMVLNSGSAQLRLSDSAVLGTPAAALASSALVTAPDGSPLIPNALLADIPVVGAADAAADAAPTTEGTVPGAPGSETADGSVPSGSTEPGGPAPVTPPVGIPTPITH